MDEQCLFPIFENKNDLNLPIGNVKFEKSPNSHVFTLLKHGIVEEKIGCLVQRIA